MLLTWSITAVDLVVPVTVSPGSVDQGPVRFYHLAIVGVFSFGLGATVVWLLFLRLGPPVGGSGSPESKPPGPDPAADGATPRRAVCIANGGRFPALSKCHLPLPVYPRTSDTTTSTATHTGDRPGPPIDVRQYFHEPNS